MTQPPTTWDLRVPAFGLVLPPPRMSLISVAIVLLPQKMGIEGRDEGGTCRKDEDEPGGNEGPEHVEDVVRVLQVIDQPPDGDHEEHTSDESSHDAKDRRRSHDARCSHDADRNCLVISVTF